MAVLWPISLWTTAPWRKIKMIKDISYQTIGKSLESSDRFLLSLSLLSTDQAAFTIFEWPDDCLTIFITGEHVFAIFTDCHSCDRLFMFDQNLNKNSPSSSLLVVLESIFTWVNFPEDNSQSLHPQSSPPVIKYCESARKAIQVILPSVWSIDRTTRASSKDQIFKLNPSITFEIRWIFDAYMLSPLPETTYLPSGETPNILQGTLY